VLTWINVDGLGRLKYAEETLTNSSQQAIGHSCSYDYDMRSQLAASSISNIAGGDWSAEYNYRKNSDIIAKTIAGQQTSFTYNGNLMKAAIGGEHFTLNYDLNGNMKNLPVSDANELVYNWDNKLRSAQKGSGTISLRYDPLGNRIWKNSSSAGSRRYIVDVVGDLPVILMELDGSGSIKKTYIYANSQIIAQYDGSHTANRYFYLHDRLGSVREIINSSGAVVNYYTYQPFGEALESSESVANPFKFTGQYFDSEIGLYYLRNRQYHPKIYRFTSRDLVAGDFQNPLSLHKYLYCGNEPANRIDPWGQSYVDVGFTYTHLGMGVGGLWGLLASGSPWGFAGGALLGSAGVTWGWMTDTETGKAYFYAGPSLSTVIKPTLAASLSYSSNDVSSKCWNFAYSASVNHIYHQQGYSFESAGTKKFYETGTITDSLGAGVSLFFVFPAIDFSGDLDLLTTAFWWNELNEGTIDLMQNLSKSQK